ncbi:MAG: hypothetical protein D6701_09140, partial [Gemmatimonadetes bacterium]
MPGPGAAAAVVSAHRVTEDGRWEYTVRRAGGPITVDGRLGEEAWSAAAPIPLLFEVAPGDNAPAPVDTECRVTFDEHNLYLGCRAADPSPRDVRAYVTDRDDIDDHDRILFVLDPFNDARRAFVFGVSALGVQFDAVISSGGQDGGPNQGGADRTWDAIWGSAGRITGSGYEVEAAIPFKSLRFPARDGVQTWGFYAARLWPRSEGVEIRSMRWDRSDACDLCQANLLTGLEGIRPGRNLEFTPTLTGGRTDVRDDFPEGDLERGDLDGEVGIDALWAITPNLALNLTANPDFSQVEADAAQLDVNTRFALFFPEKRPFFLEGADFFSTPVSAVFTRSIVDPEVGAKFTGKSGASGFGILVAHDAS